MISEEMLKKAAAEADQAIRNSLPAPADCKHEFSPSFQRKMRRIFRKANHPVIYQLPKYAACFVLVVALAGGTWLTVDVEARAAFFAWVREKYEAFVEYRFIGEAPQESEIVDYELAWLPEGFSFQKEQSLGNSSYLTYANDSGQRILFSYLQGDDATSLFMMADYTEVQSVQIGNVKADFYQASQETSPNGLVWVSEEENMCFCITASLPKDTILKVLKKFRLTVQNDPLHSFTGYKRMKGVISLKKRILPILFVFLMVFSSTAYAASPRVAQVVPGISFSGTTATCTVFIAAEQMTDDIDAVIKLWEGSRCIETWKRSSVGDLAFSGEASVTRGKTYKLTVDVTLEGKALPEFSIEGTCP